MQYCVLDTSYNWADEMDLDHYTVVDEETLRDYKKDLKKVPDDYEYSTYVGSNEEQNFTKDDGQIKEIKIKFIPDVDGNATKELDEDEVEFYKSTLADMISYNDKNYDKKLDEMARMCIIAEKNPEFIAMCEEHDRMIGEEAHR